MKLDLERNGDSVWETLFKKQNTDATDGDWFADIPCGQRKSRTPYNQNSILKNQVIAIKHNRRTAFAVRLCLIIHNVQMVCLWKPSEGRSMV